MTSPTLFVLLGMLAMVAPPAKAEILLWDNYPSGLQDPTVSMSSERNTQVTEATWTVDDVDLDQVLPGIDPSAVTLTRIEWVGARDPGVGYSRADVIVLDSDLDDLTAVEYLDLSYSFSDLVPDPNPDPDIQTYVGQIEFDPPIPVPETHFFIGVRLVGDGVFEGRNQFVTSSTDATLRGLTEGYIRAAIFGAPDWTPASDVWHGMPTPNENFEFAFRVWGVPEPASLVLLAVGAVLLSRRS